MVDNRKSPRKFDEEFKKFIVKLYESGKTQNSLSKEYGLARRTIVLPTLKASITQNVLMEHWICLLPTKRRYFTLKTFKYLLFLCLLY
jgi:hypothetical protein